MKISHVYDMCLHAYFWYYLSDHRVIYHREDGPAIINLSPSFEDYYSIDLPFDQVLDLISMHRISEKWFHHGIIHRINGPAYRDYGLPSYSEKWYKDGKLHRSDGPAWITYDLGRIIGHSWWVNNEMIGDRVDLLISSIGLSPNWWDWSTDDRLLFKLSLDY